MRAMFERGPVSGVRRVTEPRDSKITACPPQSSSTGIYLSSAVSLHFDFPRVAPYNVPLAAKTYR